MERWRKLTRRVVGVGWTGLLLVTACEIDTNVAGTDDNLVRDVETWCQARCVELQDCEINDEPLACVERCVEYFAEVSAGGATCEGASSRLMTCVERHSCGEFSISESCDLSTEETHCATADGRTFCEFPFAARTEGGDELYCDLGFSGCTDGKEYELLCSGPTVDPECDCTVDGEVTGRFSPSPGPCPEASEAIRVCGWPLGSDAAELWSSLPVTCGMHNGSVTEGRDVVTGCQLWFDDCSDGKVYEVLCGAEESSPCTCIIDGEDAGSFVPLSDVCPFALDPDGGAAALNHVCGFSIAPPEGQP